MGLLSTTKNTILNIVFPAKCLACGRPGTDLCLMCLEDSPYTERGNAKWIFSLYDYRHPPIKRALWLLKYKSRKRLANILAAVLYDKIIEELSDLAMMENFVKAILIPIPLSKKRYRERGYNQAELICRELVRLSKASHLTPPLDSLGAPLSLIRRGVGGEVFTLENDILIKPKETAHQAQIKNRLQRLKNVLGSLALKNKKRNFIQGRNIILIDDIVTTGATLNEARRILKQGGARKVVAFTVAH